MGENYSSIWLVILLPLIGFVIQAFAGPFLQAKFGKRLVGILAVVPVAAAFLLGAQLTMALAGRPEADRVLRVSGTSWIDIFGLSIPFEILVDPLAMTMVLIITGIGSLIHVYSTGYMAEEKDFSRFFAYMNLFIAAMLVLVLGGNLPMLFIGWEGVGLCSYLLIGFWYKDLANVKAANKAFIVNRVGDVSLMLAMFLITILVANSELARDARLISYDVMLPILQKILASDPAMATAIGLLLFGGAVGKSAQFPLYVWLPDAMAGPTPVSALIHAATMVTSGVVLLNRMNIVFQLSPVASAVICAVGAFTALFAALIAFGQTDIKKVLAYSTVSQLGFMFIGCGAGAYSTGMFHVTTHAFFKALLFLGAGAVIHAMSHEQDMRHYGKLFKYLPVTGATMLVGWASISAFIPFVGGFSSKEAILGSALANSHAGQLSQIAGWTGLFVAALTAAYMTRMTWLTFFGDKERWRDIAPNAHHDHDHDHHGLEASHQPKEVPASMWFPLVVLAVFSVGLGAFLHADHRFDHWLYPQGLAVLGEVKEEYPNLLLLSLVAAIGGTVAGFLVYRNGLPKNQGWDVAKWSPLRRAEANQFGFDSMVTNVFVEGGAEVANGLNKGFGESIIDGAVEGSGTLAGKVGDIARKIQSGAVRTYALVMLIGVVGIIGYFVYVSSLGGGR